MKRVTSLACSLLAMAAGAAAATAPDAGGAPVRDDLVATVSGLDAGLFDSFNHCASPDQLAKHASYLAPNLEFYHDKGGVTWSRRDYMANTRNHVCGQFRRELIPGSLEIFPVKDYGAIEQGRQKFCWLQTGKCFGEARFLILWYHVGSRWVATRVFSYGHHSTE